MKEKVVWKPVQIHPSQAGPVKVRAFRVLGNFSDRACQFGPEFVRELN